MAETDLISRQAAIDAVKKNTFRLTFAEEQNCEGHVAWSANAVYSDVMEGALLELPSAQPERKTGRWIDEAYDPFIISGRCSVCGWEAHLYEDDVVGMNYCPNCGAKMDGFEEE